MRYPFFFSNCAHLALVSPPSLALLALAPCRAYPAVPIRRSGNGTGKQIRRPPKSGTVVQVNSVFIFSPIGSSIFFLFSKWGIVPEKHLIQFFSLLSHPPSPFLRGSISFGVVARQSARKPRFCTSIPLAIHTGSQGKLKTVAPMSK